VARIHSSEGLSVSNAPLRSELRVLRKIVTLARHGDLLLRASAVIDRPTAGPCRHRSVCMHAVRDIIKMQLALAGSLPSSIFVRCALVWRHFRCEIWRNARCERPAAGHPVYLAQPSSR
jgi:hypothetical protein